jgi:hypothetical protein
MASSRCCRQIRVTLKNGAPIEAVSEAQRLLGMVDEIVVEPDIEFNRLLGQRFEGNRETSFNEAVTMLHANSPNPKTCWKAMMMHR